MTNEELSFSFLDNRPPPINWVQIGQTVYDKQQVAIFYLTKQGFSHIKAANFISKLCSASGRNTRDEDPELWDKNKEGYIQPNVKMFEVLEDDDI